MGYVVEIYKTFAGAYFFVMTVRTGHGTTSEKDYVGSVPRPVDSGQFMTTGIVHLQSSSPSSTSSGDRRPVVIRYEVTVGGITSPLKNVISNRFFTLALNGIEDGKWDTYLRLFIGCKRVIQEGHREDFMQDPVVIDIETVPGTLEQIQTYKDVKCSRCDHNPADHPKQKKDYCAECDEQAALRWHTSQTICITAKPVDMDVACFCERDEVKVLEEAYEYLNEIRPSKWIGFNIKDFDLIHLKMRGMVNDIPFINILPVGKYDKRLYDVYDVLVEGKWNKQQSATLEMFAAMLGFKELLYGSGRDVPKWFAEGKMDEIRKHNIGDVLATEQLYLRIYDAETRYRSRGRKIDDEEVFAL